MNYLVYFLYLLWMLLELLILLLKLLIFFFVHKKLIFRFFLLIKAFIYFLNTIYVRNYSHFTRRVKCILLWLIIYRIHLGQLIIILFILNFFTNIVIISFLLSDILLLTLLQMFKKYFFIYLLNTVLTKFCSAF